MVTVRFAPSPTGHLHLGSARIALFNWLVARSQGGRFLLRLEDTDRARSTQEFSKSVLHSLRWLGLTWDGEPVVQSERLERHQEMAQQLLDTGKAYWCDKPPQDADATYVPGKPALRLRVSKEGSTEILDRCLGPVSVQNSELDDMVLLRGDGTPTYMFVVVVDDYDAGVDLVIRGMDHLTNTFRQIQISKAFGWPVPDHAHVSMVLGTDGAKLSKRHGATSVDDYRKAGFLPEAVLNGLARMGWSLGDQEILTVEDMLAHFRIDALGKAPSTFDPNKLLHFNAQHLRKKTPEETLALLLAHGTPTPEDGGARILRGLPALQERSRTLVELSDMATMYTQVLLPETDHAGVDLELLRAFSAVLEHAEDWEASALEHTARDFVHARGIKLVALAQPLRIALTGKTVSPPIFEVLSILGREWTLTRLNHLLTSMCHNHR